VGSAGDDARAANQRSYGDGETVRGYLADAYHQRRRDIAVRLLGATLHGHLPGPVLELGAGSRSMLGPSLGRRPVILSDLAVDALRTARDSAGPAACPAVCLDAARPLPFRDGTLAAVVMGDLIEHLYDPRRLLRECHRILRPAGVLVLTTPNLASLQDRMRFLLGHSPRQVDPLHPYLWLHIRPFTASLLARLLRSAAFEPTAVRSNYVVWRLPSGRWLRSGSLARIAPGLGGSLVMAARKPPSL
jgi:SAM-dependent methyltransferase